MYAHVLEDRTTRPVCTGPPKSAATQQLGAPGCRSVDFDAATFRQNNQCEYVCSGHAVCGAFSGTQYLFDLQTHFTKAAPKRCQVFSHYLPPGLELRGLQGDSTKHGRDCAARRQWSSRRSCGQFVSQ